jgi:Staphylococcal nuclease homologue
VRLRGTRDEFVAGADRTLYCGCTRTRPDRLRYQRHGSLARLRRLGWRYREVWASTRAVVRHPEKGQSCDGGHWYPGPLATKALIGFIAGRPVSCHEVDYDHKNDRPVAVCFAGKDDLQALMVSAGWAWAYTAFSDQYVDAERRAAARGVGVHAHRCQPPLEWRALKRAER